MGRRKAFFGKALRFSIGGRIIRRSRDQVAFPEVRTVPATVWRLIKRLS
jgi:hypothetical protein